MTNHLPSAAAASYCDEEGAPIWTTFFATFDLGDGIGLYAFEDWDHREAAILDGRRRGMSCEAVKHAAAYQMACQGVRMWIYDGVYAYRPIFLNRRQGVGWRPVLVVDNQ